MRELIERARRKADKRGKDDPIYSIVGLGASKGSVGGEDHDDALYPRQGA